MASGNGIAYKIYRQNGEVLLAACDAELLGKTFEEGELHLEVNGTFYDGSRIDADTLQEHLNNSTMANLVGEVVIKTALAAGAISDDCVMRIAGVPHAQIYRMV